MTTSLTHYTTTYTHCVVNWWLGCALFIITMCYYCVQCDLLWLTITQKIKIAPLFHIKQPSTTHVVLCSIVLTVYADCYLRVLLRLVLHHTLYSTTYNNHATTTTTTTTTDYTNTTTAQHKYVMCQPLPQLTTIITLPSHRNCIIAYCT